MCFEEEVQKVLEPMWRRSSREVEHLRGGNESFKDESERLDSEKMRLEGELRKCRTGGDERAVAEDVCDVIVVKVGRGGGETGLKEITDELRRKNDELEGDKRKLESLLQDWGKKYKELDQRVLQLERDASMRKNEEQCVLGSREGESAVPGETDGLIDVDACGNGSTWHGDDSTGGGTVSFVHDARKKLDFGTGACLSPLAGSSRKSPVKEHGVLQGDVRTPLKEVEVITIDDDIGEPGNLRVDFLSYYKPTVDKDLGGSNQERRKKELKRKRGLRLNLIEGENSYIHGNGAGMSSTEADGRKMGQNVSIESCPSSPVSGGLGISFTRSIRDVTIVKQHGQKNTEAKVSKNRSSKKSAFNYIAHENQAGLSTAKPDDGSYLHGRGWKDAEELRSDLERDDELCMKAVCALYRRQNLARKAMDNRICQGFSGLRVLRGNFLGEFLTDRDPQYKLKRSVKDLQDHCPRGLSDCRNIALEHSNQLFTTYQKKEDPYFPME